MSMEEFCVNWSLFKLWSTFPLD